MLKQKYSEMFTQRELLTGFEAFWEVWQERPIPDNRGGMGLNHSFALWMILRKINPKIVVESGTFMGHSTWVIEQAVPDAQLLVFDLDLSKLKYRSARASYAEEDLTEFDFSEYDLAQSLFFLDDHQNSYERIKDLIVLGVSHVIFEDNFPVGKGDFYSLHHLDAGEGWPRQELLIPKSWWKALVLRFLKSAMKETIFDLSPRNPNLRSVRSGNTFLKRILPWVSEYYVFPPAYLGDNREGNVPPATLMVTMPEDRAAILRSRDLGYNFLTYLRLAVAVQ